MKKSEKEFVKTLGYGVAGAGVAHMILLGATSQVLPFVSLALLGKSLYHIGGTVKEEINEHVNFVHTINFNDFIKGDTK